MENNKNTKKDSQKTWTELRAAKDDLLNSIFPAILKEKEEIENYKRELLIDEGESISVKTRIKKAEDWVLGLKGDATKKVEELLNYHELFFKGKEDKDSLKGEIEQYLLRFEESFLETEKKKDQINTFYDKVFGVKDESSAFIGGLEKEFNKYNSRYQILFDKIESLLPGATSAGLAKVFETKVEEYQKETRVWEVISFFILSALVFYCIHSGQNDLKTITETILHLVNNLPFVVFSIWLIVFTGNRRAESKKLGESYKHKEVMARSFVGYKKQIEELGDDNDKNLLVLHTSNLLEAININSGGFLNKDGEKSPVQEIIKSIIKTKI